MGNSGEHGADGNSVSASESLTYRTTDLDLSLADFPRNDIGNAERLIARHGRDLLWVADSSNKGSWYVWVGTHFSGERGEREARLRAQATASAISNEVEALQSAGPRTGEALDAWKARVAGMR